MADWIEGQTACLTEKRKQPRLTGREIVIDWKQKKNHREINKGILTK